MDIARARVLVTGGGTGIGAATAQLLASRGARVAICGRREDVLDETAGEIGATPIVADVSREEDVVRLVRETIAALGGYDVLVNNAGFGRFAPLLEVREEDMRAVWETNVLGATLVARESARHFVAQRSGSIVNVASTAASRGYAGGSAYASSKFALNGLTQCWRAELRGYGIRVMQVNPSEVLTDFAFTARGERQPEEARKLHAMDIALAIHDVLAMDDRAMVTELTVWATNPPGAR